MDHGLRPTTPEPKLDVDRRPASTSLRFNVILLFLLATLILLGLSGCQTTKVSRQQSPVDLISYDVLARKFNQHLLGLDQLAATMTIRFEWSDKDKKRTQQADGRLAVRLPSHLRLSVTHIARPGFILWAGSNPHQYWLFDLRDKKKLHFGPQADARTRSAGIPQGMLHPRQVPWLLGIMPLDEKRGTESPNVSEHGGHYLVDLPNQRCRLWIDPLSYQAVRVDMLNDHGRSFVTAWLSEFKPVDIAGRPPDGRTRIASVIKITWADGTQQLQLRLSPASLRNHGIGDNQFDLDRLMDYFKVPIEHQINLDVPESE